MSKDTKAKLPTNNCAMCLRDSSSANAVYGLGLVGAVVYYWQQASSFMEFVVGFLKALVWPAFLVYKLMEMLGV